MNKITMNHFEKMLLSEKTLLESELVGISAGGVSDPHNLEAVSNDAWMGCSDENETADRFRQSMENASIAGRLSDHLDEIIRAIKRISDGSYGKCEACGKFIEIERLRAFPSARVSIKHAHEKAMAH